MKKKTNDNNNIEVIFHLAELLTGATSISQRWDNLIFTRVPDADEITTRPFNKENDINGSLSLMSSICCRSTWRSMHPPIWHADLTKNKRNLYFWLVHVLKPFHKLKYIKKRSLWLVRLMNPFWNFDNDNKRIILKEKIKTVFYLSAVWWTH